MATQNERLKLQQRAHADVVRLTATLAHYQHAQPFSYIETVDGLELTAVNNICLDDRCTIVEIHATHKIKKRTRDPFNDPRFFKSPAQRHGETLCRIVVKHVARRRCKVFREIYNDVIHDYGTFTSTCAGTRAVWRAIGKLLDREEIMVVRTGPKIPGGYIRSDSPLLKDLDGRRFLLESLEEQYPMSV